MERINYRSDFKARVRLFGVVTKADGTEEHRDLGWPEFDWRLRFWTGIKANAYEASYLGGECVNCVNEGGRVLVVFDRHRMGPGTLNVEFIGEVPDGLFPDGSCRSVTPQPLDVQLTLEKGDYPEEIDVDLLLPLVKGDKGDKGDPGEVTSEQFEEAKEVFRHELVGLWDETERIRTLIAELHSDKTASLLRRLGYSQDDIDEYIWACTRFDIEISQQHLERCVEAWEGYKQGIPPSIDFKVMPKWTPEIGKVPWKVMDELDPNKTLLYIPHLTTDQVPWRLDRGIYVGGVHTEIFNSVTVSSPSLRGVGSFTGAISQFRIFPYSLPYIYFGKLSSSLDVDLAKAFYNVEITDLRGVDFSNAKSMNCFAYYGGRIQRIPMKFEGNKVTAPAVDMECAFVGRTFSDTTFDLSQATSCQSIFRYSYFRDCVVSYNGPGSPFFNADGSWACEESANRVVVGPESELLSPSINALDAEEALAIAYYIGYHGYYYPDGSYANYGEYKAVGKYTCGVWELEYPHLKNLDSFEAKRHCTLWGIGANYTDDILPLDDILPEYAHLSDTFMTSLRGSFKSWATPPASVKVRLPKRYYDLIPEEEIAMMTEKGYTVACV